jgi:hypothetical protein
LEELPASERIRWLTEGKGLDYTVEKNMEFAAELITKEVAKYEQIQEKIRLERSKRKNENEDEKLVRELKSALLLQSMYNLEVRKLTI